MKKLALIFVFLTYNAHAQEALTFADCLEKAMANNLDLKSAGYDQQIAKTKHLASYGQYLPNIYAEGRLRDVQSFEIDDHPAHLYQSNDYKEYRGTVSADFNLFQGFSVHNSIKAARQQQEIVQADIERRKNEITIDLAQRFLTILYLQEIISVGQQQIDASTKQLELAQLKFDSGVIPESELFKIKAQKSLEELNLLTSQNRLSDNIVSLKQLMNLPIDAEITLIKPELTADAQITQIDKEYEFTKQAIEKLPAYKMTLLDQERAKTEWRLAQAPLLPKVTLRFMYRTFYDPSLEEQYAFHTQFDETTSKQMRLYVNVPIFNGFSAQAKARAGKLRFRQAKIESQIEENKLTKEVLKAIYDARTAVKKNEALSNAFEFSQKSYDADMLKFQMGKIDISALNITKINFNSAQAELIQSKYELLFNNALIKFYSGGTFSL
ncbi:MAG: TolC family protein [Flavobacterium sp.]|nr:MAG: TolC family protein [Flavobacterium sp.]